MEIPSFCSSPQDTYCPNGQFKKKIEATDLPFFQVSTVYSMLKPKEGYATLSLNNITSEILRNSRDFCAIMTDDVILFGNS